MSEGSLLRLPPYVVEGAVAALSETIDWGAKTFGIPRHWQLTEGAGVKVAVLDTGIAADHADLREAVEDVRDFTGSRYRALDRVGHGTHVAGIIAARRNNRGVVGVAPRCELLVAKVLGDDGSGTDDHVAAGITWAVEAGADVLSMSLGSPWPSQRIGDAVRRAVAAGRFVVCAAGNDGRANSVNFPARRADTVAVGAINRHGRLARFSSRGPQVDVCGPGQDILSTWNDGGYARISGTSMAAPFVTGVVALMIRKHRKQGGASPVTSQQELLAHLRRTARDAGPPGKDDQYGYGLIDPERVLAAADAAPAPSDVTIGPITVNGSVGSLVFVPD